MASIKDEIREAAREEVSRLLSETLTSTSEESRRQYDGESRSSGSSTPSLQPSCSRSSDWTLSFEEFYKLRESERRTVKTNWLK